MSIYEGKVIINDKVEKILVVAEGFDSAVKLIIDKFKNKNIECSIIELKFLENDYNFVLFQ